MSPAQLRSIKRAAESIGYKGASGGWVYRIRQTSRAVYAADGLTVETRQVADWRPVCQGWETFARAHAPRIAADGIARACRALAARSTITPEDGGAS